MSLTKAQRARAIAKALYLSGKEIDSIAEIIQVTARTVQSYKAADLKDGIDWEKLRVVKYMDSSQKDSESLYGDFVTHMYASLEEIRTNKELSTAQRIEAIAKLGDSFSKMRRIAAAENPEAYTHGIIKMTIQKLIKIIRPNISDECMNTIINDIKKHQEELADVSI